ncbi:CAP domain-containing protein [Geobacter sp.]|uniref:CAP domain-containing protein n=1 Tax=Geobacter sp. TaxID=46610 RepID=UPI002623F3ED|nr:CAP domain-containing protein [Geobacter sp.]
MIRRLAFALLLTVLVLLPAAGGAIPPERGILDELNAARTDPRAYAGHLAEYRSHFKGRYYLVPGSRTRIVTSEGTRGVDEAIRFLRRQGPLPPLGWSDGLARAAAELVREQGASGATGHGSGDAGMRQRIERQGEWKRTIGENVSYGPDAPRAVVMQLIIDDGVPGRGHRKNIFSPAFGVAGVACAPHPVYGTACAIDFAGGFREE